MFNRISRSLASLAFAGVIISLSITSPATAATASLPLAPFKECPAVGSAPSCQLLLVVNADRSVSVLGDPSVGPYDGTDDTLVGVLNNSHSDVPAITVTGSGTGLSLFDSDGLCTFSTGGCPYGTTGYEGPDTTLITNPKLPNSAEVDFGGKGLAPGTSTYFSLEGALTAAQVVAVRGTLEPKGTKITVTTTVATAPFPLGQDPGPAAYVRYTLKATYSDGSPAVNAAVKLSNAAKSATFHTNSQGVLSLLEPVSIEKNMDLTINATVTATNGSTASASQQVYSATSQVACHFPGKPGTDVTGLEALIDRPGLALLQDIIDYIATATSPVNTWTVGYQIQVPGSSSFYALDINIRNTKGNSSVSERILYGSQALLSMPSPLDNLNEGFRCSNELA